MGSVVDSLDLEGGMVAFISFDLSSHLQVHFLVSLESSVVTYRNVNFDSSI